MDRIPSSVLLIFLVHSGNQHIQEDNFQIPKNLGREHTKVEKNKQAIKNTQKLYSPTHITKNKLTKWRQTHGYRE